MRWIFLRQQAAHRLAEPVAGSGRASGRFVDQFRGIRRHAERSVFKVGAHILGRMAETGQFRIVDRRGSVGGDMVDEPLFHQVRQEGTTAGFDHMPPDHGDDRLLFFPGPDNRFRDRFKIGRLQHFRKVVQKRPEGHPRPGRRRHLFLVYFGNAISGGIGSNVVDGQFVVARHRYSVMGYGLGVMGFLLRPLAFHALVLS